MRITGGIYRGRELTSPQSAGTHPMGSRERLALFNSLQPYLADATVLDAYAGTGALGLEALSRGAKSVVFIEKNHRAAAVLRQNLTTLGVADATVIESAVEHFQSDAKFDLIFADPPYDKVEVEGILHLVQFLAPTGYLVLSHPADFSPIDFAGQAGLKLLSTKAYAAARISVFHY